jgi:hypothetical protein
MQKLRGILMKKHLMAATCFAILLFATFGSAKSIDAEVPFGFKAAGTAFPAGAYHFDYRSGQNFVVVRSTEKGPTAQVLIITRLAGATHTTPGDAHVVFDKIGNDHFLSELWIPGIDGFDLLNTREAHEHSIVNVPVSQ